MGRFVGRFVVVLLAVVTVVVSGAVVELVSSCRRSLSLMFGRFFSMDSLGSWNLKECDQKQIFKNRYSTHLSANPRGELAVTSSVVGSNDIVVYLCLSSSVSANASASNGLETTIEGVFLTCDREK